MKKISKFFKTVFIVIAVIGIADEALFQFWKYSNPGITFSNGTIFVASLENDFNPAQIRAGQIISFKLATEANKAGSSISPELPDNSRFLAKVTKIIDDNGKKIAWFEFTTIQTPDGEKHPLRAYLVASDSPSDSSGILRDGDWIGVGMAMAFMTHSIAAIPIGAVAGYSLSRGSSRHIETPASFFLAEVKRDFVVGIQLNRDHHLPYKRAKDFLTKIF